MAAWLPEAVAAVHGRGTPPDLALTLDSLLDRWDVAYPPGETLVAELCDGDVVGLVRVRGSAAESLVFDALTVRADVRNLSYGQEMVETLEKMKGAGVEVAYARVPPSNGLAIYFWLRTGYRPLFPVPFDVPDELDRGLLWMVRDLT